MEPISFTQLVATLLSVVLLVLCVRRFETDLLRLLQQLRDELMRIPIYSAEMILAKEAEFIRDRLPTRVPRAVILLVVLVVVTIAWWLTR